ncbi:MAG: alpha/beta hydrolase [Eubacteriales bacterium]|nr:alpha/beta hydrolase [Eubacteriales bacterium]
MQKEQFALWKEGEYHYRMAFGFVPNLTALLHEEKEKRPAVIVVPGGGYRIVSPSEGEIVAKAFYEKGYQVFVCTYTTNLLGLAPLKTQPMQDLSRAVRMIRKNAGKFRVRTDRVILCGFSAGAHLCGSLCVHFEDIEDTNAEFAGISNRPDAAVLSYPVITAGNYAHRDSFTALLGEDASEEELDYMSLERHVKKNTPPCFLWQTATDELVPVENSGLMAKALKEQGIPFACHVFSGGKHGLSLANEAWANGEYGIADTMQQTANLVQAVKDGSFFLPEPGRQQVLDSFDYDEEAGKELLKGNIPNKEAAVWPALADVWVNTVLK